MSIRQYRDLISIVLILIFFQACSFNTQSVKSIAQTNSASQIDEYVDVILKNLVTYKEKLDLRNPTSYNKTISSELKKQILFKQNYLHLIQDGKKLETYDQYLYYAFDKGEVKNRNDFLIIGLYKLMYKAFLLKKEHQFTAMQYNKNDLIKLYEYLQVVRWKIRTNKDLKDNYLFYTWQNNWQLELSKKDNSDLNIINDLNYIKTGRETIYDPSNFSFEVLFGIMLSDVEHILKKINVEPYEVGVSVLRSFVFIL